MSVITVSPSDQGDLGSGLPRAPDPRAASAPAVDVHDLTVAYDRKPVLWDVDMQIPGGVLAAIVGPNGAGKSTLIRAALGLVPIASGHVRVFGRPLARVRKRIGYVPQRETVDWDFPIDALGVVLMGRYGRLGWLRRPSSADRAVALRCLEQVGMGAYAHRQIAQLSGGQQQRVFLARALAQEADLYFMDEPFAGVDAATERAIIDLLRELRSAGKTVVAVHHDLQTVPEYFDHVAMLNLRLVACGPTAEVFTPGNLQATYGGRLTMLERVGEAMRRAAVAGGGSPHAAASSRPAPASPDVPAI